MYGKESQNSESRKFAISSDGEIIRAEGALHVFLFAGFSCLTVAFNCQTRIHFWTFSRGIVPNYTHLLSTNEIIEIAL